MLTWVYPKVSARLPRSTGKVAQFHFVCESGPDAIQQRQFLHMPLF